MATEAAEETFADVEKLIVHIARRFVRKYGGDVDLTIADAMYHFINAYETYDSKVHDSFEWWCNYKITLLLLQDRRKIIRRAKIAKMGSLDLLLENTDEEHGVHELERSGRRFDLDEFVEELSSDAEKLVRMVFKTPKPVEEEVKNRGGYTAVNFRASLRKYVTDWFGWPRRRAAAAFQEVADNLPMEK